MKVIAGSAVLVTVAVLVMVASITGYLPQQVQQPSGGAGNVVVPAGYSSFPINMNMPLKNSLSQATAVTTASVNARVYPSGTDVTVAQSPMTPPLVSSALGAGSVGTMNFTGSITNTGTSYEMKIWDTAATPAYYPRYITVTIPAYPATYTGNAILSNTFLDAIGTFGNTSQANGTYADGTALTTNVLWNTTESTVSQQLRINISTAGGTGSTTVSFKIPLVISNTVVNSKLKNVVLKPQTALSGSTIPTTAFTAASVQWNSGYNWAQIISPAGDILSSVSGNIPLTVGDVTNSMAGTINLQFTLDTSVMATGQSFLFILDDQGGYLSTDNIVAQRGAAPQTFTIAAVS